MSDIRKCALFEFFRFIFRFQPKMSCIFIFRLFFGRKRKKSFSVDLYIYHKWSVLCRQLSVTGGKRHVIMQECA